MLVYLDNAATTPLDPEVFEVMKPYLLEQYGNPSSIHAHGRKAKSAIEKARKKMAGLLNVSPAEIFFTSGGTEADNFAIHKSIETYRLKHAITSDLEHHAVLHPLQYLAQKGQIQLHYVAIDEKGNVQLDDLEQLIDKYPEALVSLMHGNNEIGNITDIEAVSKICRKYPHVVFHSDTVQTLGHYHFDLSDVNIDFISGSAHKFHGPKGTGFIYINQNVKIPPLLHGGAQERNMRGGTENVAGIVGMAKALELAHENMDRHRKHILKLKSLMIQKFKETIEKVRFHGESESLNHSLYHILNVDLPATEDNDMLLFNLDINQISASAGSACSSGTNLASHVLTALKTSPERGAIRFSFSKYNSISEIEYVVHKLSEIYQAKQV